MGHLATLAKGQKGTLLLKNKLVKIMHDYHVCLIPPHGSSHHRVYQSSAVMSPKPSDCPKVYMWNRHCEIISVDFHCGNNSDPTYYHLFAILCVLTNFLLPTHKRPLKNDQISHRPHADIWIEREIREGRRRLRLTCCDKHETVVTHDSKLILGLL